jgi:hypothetical protein
LSTRRRLAVDRALGGALQPDVERRLHLEAGLVERGGAEPLLERLADVLDEMRGERSLAVDCSQQQRLPGCFPGGLQGDEAFLGHPWQHVVVAAGQRALGVDERAAGGQASG